MTDVENASRRDIQSRIQFVQQLLGEDTPLEDADVTLLIPLEAGDYKGFRFPEDCHLKLDLALTRAQGVACVVPGATRATFVDAAARPQPLDFISGWLVTFDGLRTVEANGAFNIVADTRVFFGLFQGHRTLIAGLPVKLAELIERMQQKRTPRTERSGPTGKPEPALPVKSDGWRFHVRADVTRGTISLGDGAPSFTIAGEHARATVALDGSVRQFTIQIDTHNGEQPGTGVALDAGGFRTRPSDLHVRVAVDRRREVAGRMHRFGFDTSTLRGLSFRQGDGWEPRDGVDVTLESTPAAPGLQRFDERFTALREAAQARNIGVPPGEAPFGSVLWSRVFKDTAQWQGNLQGLNPALAGAGDFAAIQTANDTRDLAPVQAWATAIAQDLNEAFLENGLVLPEPDFELSNLLCGVEPTYPVRYALDALKDGDGRIDPAKVQAFLLEGISRAQREAYTAKPSHALERSYRLLSGRDIARDITLVADIDRLDLSTAVPRTYNWVWSINPEDATTLADVKARLERKIQERLGHDVNLANVQERLAARVGQGGTSRPPAIPAGQVFGLDALFHGGLQAIEEALSATMEQFPGSSARPAGASRKYTDRLAAVYGNSALGNALECASFVDPAGMQGVVGILQAKDAPSADTVLKRVGIAPGADLASMSAATLQALGAELRTLGNAKLQAARHDAVDVLAELMSQGPARGIIMMDRFLLELGTRLQGAFADDAQMAAATTRLLDPNERRRMAINLFSTADGLRHVSQHVLAGGWTPIRDAIDHDVHATYPTLVTGGGVGQLMPRADFRCRALTLGTGKEVTDCLVKALRDVRDLYAGVAAADRPPIGFNFWSFQADELESRPNGMVSRLLAEIKATAEAGHTAVIKVDGKNGPSQAGLPHLIADLKAAGLYPGRVLVLPWFSTSPEEFAHGTHSKDAIMPVGAFELDLNVAESYVHWTGTSHMLLGADAIRRRAQDYAHSLRQDYAPLADPTKTHPGDLWAQYYLDPDGRPMFDIEATAREFETRYESAILPEYDPRVAAGRNDDASAAFVGGGDDVRVQVFETRPGDVRDEALRETVAMLRAMEPGQTWRAVNAYVVMQSPIEETPLGAALLDAIGRGVNIEILSNSETSIDDPAASGLVIKSQFLLAEKVGADATATSGTLTLHLPKDHNTRHNKFACGGKMMLSGSYNHHPRSFTLERELVVKMMGYEIAEIDTPEAVRELVSSLFDAGIDRPEIEKLGAAGFDTSGMVPDPVDAALAERLSAAADCASKLMDLRTGWFREQLEQTIAGPMIRELEAAAFATRAKQLKLVDEAIVYLGMGDREANTVMDLPFPDQLNAVRSLKDAWLSHQAQLSRDVHGPALTGLLLFLGYTQRCRVIRSGRRGADGRAIVDRDLARLAAQVQRLAASTTVSELAVSVF